MSNVVTWKVGEFGTLYGRVGKTRYFSISRSHQRDTNTPYVLRANLPGIKKDTEHASHEAAQQTAETMLRIHLNSLVAAGVELPKADHIDATLDGELLEATAQAIARVTLRGEFACDDEMWATVWKGLTPGARLGYRLKAQAALKA